MNPFTAYLHAQLEEKLTTRRVVVWYDPNREFEPFVSGIPQASPDGDLPSVTVGETTARIVTFEGSYFALRMRVEPLFAINRPSPLLVYLPGERRDRSASPLMELECAGQCYEPQLKRMARNVMRESFSDGVIDDLLASETLGYADILSLIEQDTPREGGSLLKLVYGTQDPVAVTAEWLAKPGSDSSVQEKEAGPELAKLLASRAGFDTGTESLDSKQRSKLARCFLVNEFRDDLQCEPPKSISLVPRFTLKEQREFREKVLAHLRSRFPAEFEALADEVESEHALAHAGIDAALLGRIDTFRFEEKAMLRHCAQVIAEGEYEVARQMVNLHSQSFWATRDMSRRQAQWEVCALLAELGREVDRVLQEVKSCGPNVTSQGLIEKYARTDGWHRMDQAHRRLETRAAQLEEEPEAESALSLVRMKVEETLRAMAEVFSAALERDEWTVAGILHQTGIYPAKVKPLPGRVAWFHVDAFRFEMGADLAVQLSEVSELSLQPAVAALPSITPLCMAALLPGASASYSVVESNGKAAAKVGGAILGDVGDRMKYLRANVPDSADITLDQLLQGKPSQVRSKIQNARLLVIRSQEIDAIGEKAELLARHVMDTLIGNVARAVRKLAGLGFERFVITADHGHQFAGRREDDMKLNAPSGTTVELHRRCWIGRGAATQLGSALIASAALGYDSNLEFVFPIGLGVFKAGGGLAYHHGGFSLQELVIPVLTFRMQGPEKVADLGPRVSLSGHPEAITTRTFGVQIELEADLMATEPLDVRVLLVAKEVEAGKAGMAVGAELSRETGVLRLPPGKATSVAMVLTRDDVDAVRIVVQDASSGAVLSETSNLPVQLKL